jgi:rRNA maturation protein Nop10
MLIKALKKDIAKAAKNIESPNDKYPKYAAMLKKNTA